MTCRCPWCDRLFVTRKGGKPQRFCRTVCRRAYWVAANAYVDSLVRHGRVTIDTLKAYGGNAGVETGAGGT